MLKGKIATIVIESTILKSNPLGDPFKRECPVYVPPGYSDAKTYPLLIDLAPYTSSGLARIAWKNFSKSVPERIEELILNGKMAEVIVAFPDCYTKLGGNQYINSSALGNYSDHLYEEIVPAIENEYNCGTEGKRGLYGKSSGGYAALVHGMKRPDFWSAVACHSGDIDFELGYMYDMPQVIMTLAKYDYSIKDFLEKFWRSESPGGAKIHLLMMLAMAATYDPSSNRKDYMGIRLPVDLNTMEVIQDRWRNWLSHDPLHLVIDFFDNLKKLKLLFIDCGVNDQYRLQYGARKLHNILKSNNIAHEFEEFEGTHSGIDHRLEVSLPKLVGSLI